MAKSVLSNVYGFLFLLSFYDMSFSLCFIIIPSFWGSQVLLCQTAISTVWYLVYY